MEPIPADPIRRSRDPVHPNLIVGSIVIFIVTFAALWPVLLAPFVWDDDLYITMNKTLARPGGLPDIWIRPYASPSPYPLVFTTYWFEYKLWGLAPAGYRIINMLLHAGNAILLWRVLRRLGLPGAWLAGAIFAVHPVHVESVAHVAERKDVLSGLFYFVSLLYWCNFAADGKQRSYFLSFAAFVAAMLAKTVTCTLPPLLILLALWKAPKDRRVNLIRRTAPYFVIALGLGIYTILWERHRTGATTEVIPLDFVQRILVASRALWFYFLKLAWPTNLVTLYPKWEMSVTDSLNWSFPLGVAAIGAILASWGRIYGRQIILPFVFVIITLGPALGFVNFSTMYYSYVMDHYQYLACAGWIVLFCIGWSRVAARLGGNRMNLSAGAALLGVLCFLSFQQSQTFRTLETLWAHNVRGNPQSAPPRYDYGVALEDEGRTNEAQTQFLEAVRLNPNDVDSYLHLGGMRRAKGDLDSAVRYFEWAARVEPDHPKARRSQASAYNHIGGIRVEQGRYSEAVAAFEEALAINPALVDARVNLGVAYARMNDSGRAEEIYRDAMREFPTAEKPAVYLYRLLRKEGRATEATRGLERAIEANPENILSRVVLAQELLEAGNRQAARQMLEKCLDIDRGHVEANNLLGVMEAQAGNYEAAIGYFDAALKTEPRNPAARANKERAEHDMSRPSAGKVSH